MYAPRPPVEKKKGSSACLWIALGLLLLACLVITPTVYFLFQAGKASEASVRESYEANFLPHLPAYMAKYEPTNDDLPLITGKLLIVDMDSKAISDLHYKLPQELRAASPADLTVVVQHRCFTTEGTRTCRLTLVDPKNRKTLMWQDFIGSEARRELPFVPNGDPLDETGAYLSTDLMIHWLVSWVQ